jgi:hypothetical protein
LKLDDFKNKNIETNIVPFFAQFDSHVKNTITKIAYFGRIVKSKCFLLIKIAKYLNYQVDFYGPIIFKIPKKYLKYCKFLGSYKNEEYKTLIKNYNYIILLSKFEGFSISLAESLTYSTPIIVLDTYLNAKFLTNDNKNGLLVNLPNPKYKKLFKKSNLKIMAKQINDFIAKDN